MIYTTDIPHFSQDRRSVITLGKFDGLHRGHQKLVNRVLEIGRDGYDTVIFTFDVSPLIKLGKKKQKYLLTNEERKGIAMEMGVDYLIECPFTDALIAMTPEDFVTEFLVRRLHCISLVVGTDFRFGHNRAGTPQLLAKMGQELGFVVEILDKEMSQGREISSSYVRDELKKGHMECVNLLLGYTYFTRGEIVHGRKLGRTIGVPTINLVPERIKQLPPNGVYVTKTDILGRQYQGITNVGYKPTVKENFLGVETYLFDCNENLYGLDAQVRFFHYLRPEQRFASLDELQAQLAVDVRDGREFFQNNNEDFSTCVDAGYLIKNET